MITYQILTGNPGLFEFLLEKPIKGPDWETKCEMSDNPTVADESHVVVITPDGEVIKSLPISPAAPMGIKAAIGMDLLKRKQGNNQPSPATVAAAQGGLRQYVGTTGEETIAKIFKETTSGGRWTLTVTHRKELSPDYIQILADGGAVLVTNVPISPRGNLMDRLRQAVSDHYDGKQPVVTSTAPPPARLEPQPEGQQARPIDPAEGPPADRTERYVAIADIITGDNIRTDMGDLDELAADIKRRGVKQALTVRQEGDKFKLIAGERRLRAARLAGLRWVPCLVDDDDEERATEWMISENAHRKPLSPIEEARGYQRLMVTLKTREAVAAAVNRSRVHVTEYLQLLDLPADLQHQVATGFTPVKTALEFLRRTRDDSEEARRQVAAGLTQEKTSTRAAGETIERLRQGAGAAPATPKQPQASQAPPAGPAPGPATPAPQPEQPRPAGPVAPVTSSKPAAPEVARATKLKQIGQTFWRKHFADYAGHEVLACRDTYCSLEELQAHWARRTDIAGANMPLSMGRCVVDIPEAKIWFGSMALDDLFKLSVFADDIAINVADGAVRTLAYDGSPVFYTVELIDTDTEAAGILQQLVIQDGDRHIVVTGYGSTSLTGERLLEWRQQHLHNLPITPVV